MEALNRERAAAEEPLISFVDISQTVTRMAQSTEDSQALDGKNHEDDLMLVER